MELQCISFICLIRTKICKYKAFVSEMLTYLPNQICLQTQLVFLSGKTGVQIGSTVVVDSTDTTNHLLYSTADGARYVLLQKGEIS